MHKKKRLQETLESTSAFAVSEYLVETEKYAIAKSINDEIGVTWNKDVEERKNGFPHTWGYQQWFILPEPLANMVLSGANLFKSEISQSKEN